MTDNKRPDSADQLPEGQRKPNADNISPVKSPGKVDVQPAKLQPEKGQ